MSNEEIFCKAVMSQIAHRKCAVSVETRGNGRIELHGHIHLKDSGTHCAKLYCQSSSDWVEIAAANCNALNWMAEHLLDLIPNYFEKFQNDNIVPVFQWRYDWSIIHVKIDDFQRVIDEIFAN